MKRKLIYDKTLKQPTTKQVTDKIQQLTSHLKYSTCYENSMIDVYSIPTYMDDEFVIVVNYINCGNNVLYETLTFCISCLEIEIANNYYLIEDSVNSFGSTSILQDTIFDSLFETIYE